MAGTAALVLMGVAPVAAQATADSAIVVESEANAVRVIAVPAPAHVRQGGGTFAFAPVGAVHVLGASAGPVPAGSDQPIALAISIPARAAAGRLEAGRVQFRCATDCGVTTIPVVVNVRPRFSIALDAVQSLFGAYAGAEITATVNVLNAGNADEAAEISVDVPNGWNGRVDAARPVRIPAGVMTRVPLRISVTRDASMGDYGVVVHARSRGGPTTSTSILVRVSPLHTGGIGAVPTLTTALGVARDDAGGTTAAYTLRLAGRVSDGTVLRGQASAVPDHDALSGLTRRSLGRLGFSPRTGFLHLTGNAWDVGAGNIGVADAGIVASSLWGTGVTGSAETGTWRGRVLGARPAPRSGGSAGHYALLEGARNIGGIWAGAALADLEDDAIGGRRSQVTAASISVPWARERGQASVEIGRRTADTAVGLSWAAHGRYRDDDWALQARVGRSFGGSAAFARADEEFAFDAFRSFGRAFAIGGGVWEQADGNRTASRSRGSGWSVAPQARMARMGAIAVDFRATTWDGRNAGARFGNAERMTSVFWNPPVQQVQARLGVSAGRIERSSALDDAGASASTTASRTSVSVALARATSFATLQLDAEHDRSGAGVGIPGEQTTVGARIADIAVVPGRVYAHVEALSYYLGRTGTSLSSQRAGVTMRVSDSYAVTFDAERSAFLRGAGSASPWVVTAKLEHLVGVPFLRRSGASGVVYADRNGDGRRGRGEPGVPNIVVRLNGELVTTDREGRFPVGLARPNQVEVDPRSLAPGWVVAPRSLGRDAATTYELAVVPTTPVEVVIRAIRGDGLDSASVHLERAVLILTDSLGRTWTGAPDSAGVLRIDALPPGAYELSADLSLVGAVLLLPDQLPIVRVTGGRTVVRTVLEVRPRPVRLTPSRGQVRRIGSGGN